jgi:hypothetical protein
MNSSIPHYPANCPIPREQYLSIIRTGIAFREFRFVRRAISNWLAAYPGDLPFRYQYAYALYKEGHAGIAIPILEEISQIDPEYLDALETILKIKLSDHAEEHSLKSTDKLIDSTSDFVEWIVGLKGDAVSSLKEPHLASDRFAWGNLLFPIRESVRNTQPAQSGGMLDAENNLLKVLANKPGNPLVALVHLEWVRSKTLAGNCPAGTLNSLANYYHTHFPDCLQCALIQVECLFEQGQHEKAVALLHLCASRDITGQVARRLWGIDHPYQNLWPVGLERKIDQLIPASIASFYGWNLLSVGNPTEINPAEATSTPDEIQNFQRETTSGEQEGFAKEETNPAIEELTIDSSTTPEAIPLNLDETSDVAKAVKAVSSEQPAGEETYPTVEEQTANQGEQTVHAVELELPEPLRQIQAELRRVGDHLHRPDLANSDGRLPVYVIMTNRTNLEKSYGTDQSNVIEKELLRLRTAIQASTRWRSVLFYPDKGFTLPNEKQVCSPAKPDDPWGLKLALVDLDNALSHNGEMVGCVMIVGGGEIVPFHKLPNPVDDNDEEVPSDNPYSTRDENYFIPEWSIGRLPTSMGDDGSFLLKLVRNLIAVYSMRTSKLLSFQNSWLQRLLSWTRYILPGLSRNGKMPKSFGYTAAAWRFASFTVFRSIGEPNNMLISPPTRLPTKMRPAKSYQRQYVPRVIKKATATVQNEGVLARTAGVYIPDAKLGYFNLHGLENSPEWYGQSDLTEAGYQNQMTTDYPIALQPGDVGSNGQRAPQVVFSEACYGGNIQNKTRTQALVFRFLEKGTLAMAASTCTSYGAVTTPLTAADYLGSAFWQGIRQGLSAGESLRRAKISLASEMHRRSGYLDGEDQKTLIAYVLYGDPLTQPLSSGWQVKSIQRTRSRGQAPQAICDHSLGCVDDQMIQPETLRRVKEIVESYLPGMRDASMSLRNEQVICHQNCPGCQAKELIADQTSPDGGKHPIVSSSTSLQSHQVVILSKQTQSGIQAHHQYARITMDQQGKVLKLVVSR